MSVKVDVSDVIIKLKKINEGTIDNLISTTKFLTGSLLNDTKRKAPKDTGELAQKQTMTVEMKGNVIEGRVEAYAPHAVYVHEGTGIYAKNGKGRKRPWMYEVKSGKYKGVHWTWGNKPNPWMDDTIAANKDKIIGMYRGVLGKI